MTEPDPGSVNVSQKTRKNHIQKSWDALGEHLRRPNSWTYTLSLRFLGIILRVRRFEVSAYDVYITNQFKPLLLGRGGGGGVWSVSRGNYESQRRKIFVPINSKNSASGVCGVKRIINHRFFYWWWSFIVIRYILICSSFFYKMAPVKCKIYVMYYGEIREPLAVRNAPNNFKIKSILF